jgi:hypothetical protein
MIRRSSTPDVLETSLSIYQLKVPFHENLPPLPSHCSGVPGIFSFYSRQHNSKATTITSFGSSFSSLLIQDVSLLCLISAITPWHKTIAGYSIQASSSTMASLFSFLSSCLNKLFKCIQNNINKSNCSIAFNWCLTLNLL